MVDEHFIVVCLQLYSECLELSDITDIVRTVIFFPGPFLFSLLFCCFAVVNLVLSYSLSVFVLQAVRKESSG